MPKDSFWWNKFQLQSFEKSKICYVTKTDANWNKANNKGLGGMVPIVILFQLLLPY